MRLFMIITAAILCFLTGCQTPFIEWHHATFVDDWRNYGVGVSPVMYGKDINGQIHIIGWAVDDTPAASSNIFNLPEGYRPASIKHFIVFAYSSPIASTEDACITIGSSGEVFVSDINGSNIGNVDLGEIIFSIDY